MTDKELSFWEHLDELRKVLFRVIIVLAIITIGSFIVMPWLFEQVILAPCHDNFVFYSFLHRIGDALGLSGEFFSETFDIKLININLTAQFFIHVSTSLWLAVLIAMPYILFEVWKYVQPALYPKEEKAIKKALFLGGGMFYLGVIVGYLMVFPLTLRFLSTYELSASIENQLTLNSYIDNFMLLLLCMGLAFELPLVTWILSLLGIINKSFLRKYRRHALVIIVVVAAIITPTGDPFTLTAVSLPMYLLYELGIAMIKDKA